MSGYTISDMIKYSVEQKPIDFQQAFSDLLSDKLQAAVDVKKIEVAQNMFSGTIENEDTDTEE